jgi:aspartyl-tRNA(Asn)/glutamyl-tRNA(Gln) amidotransferase subunit C
LAALNASIEKNSDLLYNGKNEKLLAGGGVAMAITISDVEHVAKLARLDLTDQEKNQFTEQLNAILKYMEKLNELDTANVDPTSHAMDVANVMREDKARPSWPLEKVLLNAPDEEDGQIKVPAVLE